MSREENVLVFEDTTKLVKNNKVLAEKTKQSIAAQEIYLEKDVLPDINRDIYSEPVKIVVSKKRSFEAAMGYVGSHIAVHNFASATNPGGGVAKGSSAQEEALCRCSNLYFALVDGKNYSGFYMPHRKQGNPLHNDDIICTPDIIVFKTDTSRPKLLPESQWLTVDVITCAAPNLRTKPSNTMNPYEGSKVKITNSELRNLHEKRLRRILDVAVLKSVDTIILGAFGCGAFQNSPVIVADAAKTVLEEYKYAFKRVEFAVYCGPRDAENYLIFKNKFGC